MAWLAILVVASAIPLELMTNYLIIQRRLLPHCDRVCSLLPRDMTGTFFIEDDYIPGSML